MAGSRTLKLSILADVDNLSKNLKTATDDTEGFAGKLGDFAKKSVLAFAAVGAVAVKFGVDFAKAAAEDEAAALKLSTTLENVTGATKAQTSAVEDYITKTELAFGVTDDKLRPSLDRLVRATKDVAEAEKLQALAMDISAGTGKDLQAVSEALAKAHDGNFAALKKLGVSIDDSIIKSKDFNAATQLLSDTFEGQASKQADTFAGKMDRLKLAVQEGKETIGSYILDAVTPLVDGLVNNVIPAIQNVADNFGSKLKPAFEDIQGFVVEFLIPAIKELWDFLINTLVPAVVDTVTPIIKGLFNAFSSVRDAIVDNQDKLKPLFDLLKVIASFILKTVAPAIGTVLGAALTAVGKILGGLISGFSAVLGVIEGVVGAIRTLVSLVASNPVVKGISGLISSAFGGGKASGGPVSAGTTYLVGEKGPELFMPSSNGSIVPNHAMGGNTINLTVNGAIDPEGTARTIVDVLNRSAARGALGAQRLNFA